MTYKSREGYKHDMATWLEEAKEQGRIEVVKNLLLDEMDVEEIKKQINK